MNVFRSTGEFIGRVVGGRLVSPSGRVLATIGEKPPDGKLAPVLDLNGKELGFLLPSGHIVRRTGKSPHLVNKVKKFSRVAHRNAGAKVVRRVKFILPVGWEDVF